MRPIRSSTTPGSGTGKVVRRFLLAACLLLFGRFISVAATTSNAPSLWPPLAEVLQRWDAIPLDAVNQAAERGELTAQHYLGFCYTEGHRVAADATIGVPWYERAGNAGYAPSWNNLGTLYQRGKGVPQDPDRMLQSYRRAAEQGLGRAMYSLYQCYLNGNGVTEDRKAANDWLIKGASAGEAIAQCELGYLFIYPPDEEDESKPRVKNPAAAVHWFQLSAEQNFPPGEYWLGLCCLKGKGVEKDEERGLALMRHSADHGEVRALHELARLYVEGIGAPRNFQDEPMQLWQRLARSGSGGGYHPIIFHALAGLGTPRDWMVAASWYCRAAAAGQEGFTLQDSVEPGFPLRKAFRNSGPSAESDRPWVHLSQPNIEPFNDGFLRVLKLYRAAAAKNSDAALEIARMYLSGRSVPSSLPKAWLWFTLAARTGSSAAQTKAGELELRMTGDELKEAQKELPDLVAELNRVAAAGQRSGQSGQGD